MKCINHEFHLKHVAEIYSVIEDPNSEKVTKHIFHRLIILCHNCDFSIDVKSMSDSIEDQGFFSAEEFKEILAEKSLDRGEMHA